MSYIRKADRCHFCYGTGEDGDPPDAAGVGGWVGACSWCNSTGLKAVADELAKRRTAQDLLTEALDLVPRISGDDPMAPALADWCRKVRATSTVTGGRDG